MSNPPRKVLVIGNWKCNGDRTFTNKQCMFLTTLQIDKKTTELAVAIPDIHLVSAKVFLTGKVFVVSQNISHFDNGPYTGETSAKMLMDIGVDWAIIGHSERRLLFKEDEKILSEKLKRAFEAGMHVVYCIGEDLDKRDVGIHYEALDLQLDTLIANADKFWEYVVVCYEPVWSIGTGKTISADHVQEVHDHIRKYLKTKVSEDVSKATRIIYGGSVKEDNAAELIDKKDVDGFMVGATSLKKEEFQQVVDAAKNKKFEEENPPAE